MSGTQRSDTCLHEEPLRRWPGNPQACLQFPKTTWSSCSYLVIVMVHLIQSRTPQTPRLRKRTTNRRDRFARILRPAPMAATWVVTLAGGSRNDCRAPSHGPIRRGGGCGWSRRNTRPWLRVDLTHSSAGATPWGFWRNTAGRLIAGSRRGRSGPARVCRPGRRGRPRRSSSVRGR